MRTNKFFGRGHKMLQVTRNWILLGSSDYGTPYFVARFTNVWVIRKDQFI